MQKKGFIFDLDGVIVDTAKYHYFAWKQLAERIGISFSEADNEHLKGVSRIRSLELILEWGDKELSTQDFNRLLAVKNEDYLSYVNQMTEDEVLPDVPRVLAYLKTHKQPTALGSASKNARSILSRVKLLDQFDCIVDGTNVTKAKPDPEVFLQAAEILGLPPESCIVFEDSLAGIEAANTAGMVSIGIGSAEVLKEARYCFTNFTEISNNFLHQLIITI